MPVCASISLNKKLLRVSYIEGLVTGKIRVRPVETGAFPRRIQGWNGPWMRGGNVGSLPRLPRGCRA